MTTERPYGVAPPAYRLPDEAHVGAVRLQVSDLQQSLEFYRDVLGLRLQAAGSNAAALGPDDDGRALVRLETKPGVTRARRGALGLYHFAILLPDRAALGRFVAHLAEQRVRVSSADHLVSEALYLWDPDGLGIEVYADRPRSEWRHEGRQLAMATDPLDIDDLLRAGGGTPWTGMPEGTRMGHVHLHVGDLAQAERFYHHGLGLEKMVWQYPGALFLAAGGYHHHLGTNVWSPGPPARDSEARLLEWELIVPAPADVDAAAMSLSDHGFRAEVAGATVRTADPWGTELRLEASRKPKA